MSSFVHDLLVARRAIGHDRFVFPSSGKSGHIAEPKFPLRQVAVASGISISAHDLRRTYITVAESCDISPLALKALVNHALGGDVIFRLCDDECRAPARAGSESRGPDEELVRYCDVTPLPCSEHKAPDAQQGLQARQNVDNDPWFAPR